MSRREGFSLIEVLVAMALLAIGMTGILSLFSAAVTLQQESTERMDVSTLAPGVMTEVRAEIARRLEGRGGAGRIQSLNGLELPVPQNPGYRYRITIEPGVPGASEGIFLCRVELLARLKGGDRAYDFGYLPIVLEEDNDARIRDLMGR